MLKMDTNTSIIYREAIKYIRGLNKKYTEIAKDYIEANLNNKPFNLSLTIENEKDEISFELINPLIYIVNNADYVCKVNLVEFATASLRIRELESACPSCSVKIRKKLEAMLNRKDE